MSYWIGRLWLWVFGWKLEGKAEAPAKYVFIAAPHTSYWDFPFMLATAFVLRTRVCFLGKHTLFTAWYGGFYRWLGGIPVDRRSPQNLVSQIAERFHESTDLILAVPPEGTRSKVGYWKSGFYHIALNAGVPVGFGYLDYERRCCGLGGFLHPTGNIRDDMDVVRAFYESVKGKHPEKVSPIRLREEEVVQDSFIEMDRTYIRSTEQPRA